MKKYLAIFVFTFLSLFIFGMKDASAACSWVEQKTYYDTALRKVVISGGCAAIQTAGTGTSCSSTKPTYDSSDGVAKTAVCCCDKAPEVTVASGETCSWQQSTTYYDSAKRETVQTSCSAGTTVYGNNNCPGTKPTYDSSDGVARVAVCCCKTGVTSVTNQVSSAPRFTMPEFQIKLPGLDRLSDVKCENGICKIPWISEYTFALYEYGLSIAGILGVLILMAAGLLWIVSGGDQNKISQAKKMIFGSITGLIILVGANLILTNINPDLAKSKSIDITYIEKIDVFALSAEEQALAPTSAGSSHGVPWYFQCSATGKNTSYDLDGKCKDSSTICTSGCGVVATLMVLNKFNVNPTWTEFADKVEVSGGRVCNNGSAAPGLIKAATTYGLKGSSLSGIEAISKKLDEGFPVIISVRNTNDTCIFTKGGHFIVLTGWRDKAKQIADVNDSANSKKAANRTWISLKDLGGCSLGQAFYLYK